MVGKNGLDSRGSNRFVTLITRKTVKAKSSGHGCEQLSGRFQVFGSARVPKVAVGDT